MVVPTAMQRLVSNSLSSRGHVELIRRILVLFRNISGLISISLVFLSYSNTKRTMLISAHSEVTAELQGVNNHNMTTRQLQQMPSISPSSIIADDTKPSSADNPAPAETPSTINTEVSVTAAPHELRFCATNEMCSNMESFQVDGFCCPTSDWVYLPCCEDRNVWPSSTPTTISSSSATTTASPTSSTLSAEPSYSPTFKPTTASDTTTTLPTRNPATSLSPQTSFPVLSSVPTIIAPSVVPTTISTVTIVSSAPSTVPTESATSSPTSRGSIDQTAPPADSIPSMIPTTSSTTPLQNDHGMVVSYAPTVIGNSGHPTTTISETLNDGSISTNVPTDDVDANDGSRPPTSKPIETNIPSTRLSKYPSNEDMAMPPTPYSTIVAGRSSSTSSSNDNAMAMSNTPKPTTLFRPSEASSQPVANNINLVKREDLSSAASSVVPTIFYKVAITGMIITFLLL